MDLNTILHTYSTTQLAMIASGGSLNYERSKIMTEIESKHKNGQEEPSNFWYDANDKCYQVVAGKGCGMPKRKAMTADEYRKFMGGQGLKFISL